jgi:hypothetical protein
MSNGTPFSRALNPVKCRMCGAAWDRQTDPEPTHIAGGTPPWSVPHTDADWEAFFAANDPGLPIEQQRTRWLKNDPPLGSGKEVKAPNWPRVDE